MFKRILLFTLLVTAAPVAAAKPIDLDYVGQCVPFARAASGIQIFGDAWTWWGQAKGKYLRGKSPRVGAVIVFAKTNRLPLGHVAAISRVVTPRVVMATHANWSRVDGARGHAEQDVTITDISAANDWSVVKVWYRDLKGLGSTGYPVYGFVYGTRDARADAAVAEARPAPYLSSARPDYVGALIDVYAH